MTERRRYDSPVRRQQAAETRERILAAGAEILHEQAVWNWRALTVRGVAERAGVNERTVYRHFPSERHLRDAVLARLTDEAGVDLDSLELEDLQATTARVLEFVSAFPLEARRPSDPTLVAADARLREALLRMVGPETSGWSSDDRVVAAAMLDVLWSVVTYETLVAGWGLEPQDAIRGVTWAIGLVEDALREGRRP